MQAFSSSFFCRPIAIRYPFKKQWLAKMQECRAKPLCLTRSKAWMIAKSWRELRWHRLPGWTPRQACRMVGSEDNIYAFGQTSGSEEKLRAASERPDLTTLRPDLNLKLSQQGKPGAMESTRIVQRWPLPIGWVLVLKLAPRENLPLKCAQQSETLVHSEERKLSSLRYSHRPPTCLLSDPFF